MLQEIQVKDATSSQAPQASSMTHGMFKTTILVIFSLCYSCQV